MTGSATTRIFRNTGAFSFVEQTQENIVGVNRGDVRFGDLDADGDLDLIVTGEGKERISKIYLNKGTKKNATPVPPFNLRSVVTASSALLR